MIPQSFIQELIARIDIVEVVGRVVKLRKAGANYLGLCPFHGEKSPSFTVSPSKQFYHCFGCGAHGSAIGFLMEQAGLSYVDAIGDLARSQGLVVPQEGGQPNSRPRDPDVLESLSAAARFYKLRLKDSLQAIEYLKGRGVSGETAARFAMGYAPEGWRGLQAAVPDYFADSLLEAGLVIEPEDAAREPGAEEAPRSDGPARRRYDRFRDRIMFPIRNPRGQVIGFGGRVMGAGEPKYLNSPETPVFSKGRELYGLFEGRDAIRTSGFVLVVEGYMDVVMLAQHGVGNAVATLGTATTAQHVQKLLRIADRLVFAFDGDAAGKRAAWRALEACLPHASDTRRIDFLFLPTEHDPDSFVREHGAQGFRQKVDEALSLSAFMLGELSARVDLETPEGRARLQADARPLLQAMPEVALRLQLVQAVATRARVRPEDVQQFLAAGSALAGTEPPPRQTPSPQRSRTWGGSPAPRPRSTSAALPDLQARARLLLALHPGMAREPRSLEFLPTAVVEWLERVAALPADSTFASLLESVRAADPGLAESLQSQAAQDRGLLADLTAEDARVEFDGALARLRARGLQDEVDALASAGLRDEASRQRYASLQALRRSIASPT